MSGNGWAWYIAVLGFCFYIIGDPFGVLDGIGWWFCRRGLARVPPEPLPPVEHPRGGGVQFRYPAVYPQPGRFESRMCNGVLYVEWVQHNLR